MNVASAGAEADRTRREIKRSVMKGSKCNGQRWRRQTLEGSEASCERNLGIVERRRKGICVPKLSNFHGGDPSSRENLRKLQSHKHLFCSETF
jgi:hypothetical protein